MCDRYAYVLLIFFVFYYTLCLFRTIELMVSVGWKLLVLFCLADIEETENRYLVAAVYCNFLFALEAVRVRNL